MYLRHLTGSIKLYQFIGFGIVISLSKAFPIDGGNNRYHLSIKRRIDTAL